MEGIGTEATRANIIDTLKNQQYIEIKKNIVTVTTKGETLCKVIGEPVEVDYVIRTGNDVGFAFPKDYVNCVAINNGANVEPELFEVDNREKVFGTLLSFNDEFIVSVFKSYKL